MTTTYELYTNENGTPKAVEGKAPAILERVEALETSVETLEGTLDNGVVTSVNGNTGDVTVDVGVTSVNGNTGDITPEQTGCLPLSGGKLTGAITLNTSTLVNRSGDDSNLQINGGSGWGKGASIELYGKDRTTDGGAFKVRVHNGTTYKDLIAKPDGTLTWGGKGIVRSVNGTNADASGNVAISVPPTPKAYITETWASGKNWYRKWSDGWIEQGGETSSSNTVDTYYTNITLHLAMKSKNCWCDAKLIERSSGNMVLFHVYSNLVSTTQIQAGPWGTGKTVRWYVCGY